MKKDHINKNIIFLYYAIFFLFLDSCINTSPPPRPLIEVSSTAKDIVLGSFIVSVIAFIISLLTNDDERRTVAGIGSIVFLIVSIIILLTHIKG